MYFMKCTKILTWYSNLTNEIYANARISEVTLDKMQ